MAAKLPMLSVDDLTKVVDLGEITMDVAEWGGSILLRAFTIDERDQVLSECTGKDGKVDGQKLLRGLVVHGVREPKLTHDWIAGRSFAVVERVAKEIMRLNGMESDKGASAATVADVTFRPE
jgi:hypothetical protein